MAKRKGSPTSREDTSSQRESEETIDHDAREAENAQRLDKLPQEVWEKILYELKNDDFFPLALSCRYFRQNQTVREELLNIKRMEIQRMRGPPWMQVSPLFLLLLCFGF